jgi:hypothetical protein
MTTYKPFRNSVAAAICAILFSTTLFVSTVGPVQAAAPAPTAVVSPLA